MSKQLRAEWDRRLKESGFVDIEIEIDGERFIRSKSFNEGPHQRKYGTQPEVVRDSKAEYFRLLLQCFSNELNFADDSDRLIMELTTDGKSITDISKQLRTNNMRKHNRDTIRYIRRRYENRWGIKLWPQHQMTSRKPTRS